MAGLALLEHALHGADPGLVGLALSYALGITSKLSGLVTSGQSRYSDFLSSDWSDIYSHLSI